MSAKIFLIICAQAILVKTTYSQCAAGLTTPWGPAGAAAWNGLAIPALAAPGLAGAFGAGCGGVASTGGGFLVTSVSPIAPTGVSVVSENAFEGSLAAGGNLPLLGTIAFEGVLPTAGEGAVSYGCGNGAVRIVAEDGPVITGIVAPESFAPAAGLAAPGIAGAAGYGLGGIAGYGLGERAGSGLGGLGCGCGVLY